MQYIEGGDGEGGEEGEGRAGKWGTQGRYFVSCFTFSYLSRSMTPLLTFFHVLMLFPFAQSPFKL
jgi:hypothetical protein